MENIKTQFFSCGDKINHMILNENLLSKIIYGLLCFVCLVLFSISLYKQLRKKWQSHYFVMLCAVTFFWSSFVLLSFLIQTPFPILKFAMICFFFVPGLVCMNIWQQVSYKVINPMVLFVTFFIPFIISIMQIFYINTENVIIINNARINIINLLFYIYAYAALIKSYLLCFNVFYQMPRHMRASSVYMLFGITMVLIFMSISISRFNKYLLQLAGEDIANVVSPLIGPIAILIAIYSFYSAFYVTPSANVIITSRDFVFNNLSTAIFVLSMNKRVMDWNKKDEASIYPLPMPKYKQTFEKYKERMLSECNGKVHSQEENIITLTVDGKETHYLISTRDIGQKNRQLGYLVEVAEVTKIQSMLRLLENIALIDQLTSFFNRNAYMSAVPLMTQKENLPLAVIVGDVNKLKIINDTQGHLIGDELLKEVSRLIEKCAPKDALTYRIGGDEFVLLVPNSNEDTCLDFIQTIFDECKLINDEGGYGQPSVAWGYAIMNDENQVYNEVFEKADSMMYEYKKKMHTFRSSGLIPKNKNNEE